MTIIIKLYDESDYQYPLIEIKKDSLNLFRGALKEYQKNEEYNIDDFIFIIQEKSWFIKEINFDEEIYF